MKQKHKNLTFAQVMVWPCACHKLYFHHRYIEIETTKMLLLNGTQYAGRKKGEGKLTQVYNKVHV